MTPEEFAANFKTLADAPGGIKKLRDMVHDLALRGKLLPQHAVGGTAMRHDLSLGASLKLDSADTQSELFNLPMSWKWVPVGATTTLVTDGEHNTPPRIPKAEGRRPKYLSQQQKMCATDT